MQSLSSEAWNRNISKSLLKELCVLGGLCFWDYFWREGWTRRSACKYLAIASEHIIPLQWLQSILAYTIPKGLLNLWLYSVIIVPLADTEQDFALQSCCLVVVNYCQFMPSNNYVVSTTSCYISSLVVCSRVSSIISKLIWILNWVLVSKINV